MKKDELAKWFELEQIQELEQILASVDWADKVVTRSDAQAVLDGCYYDDAKARRFEQFCEKFIVQVTGRFRGKPLILFPWQKEVFRKLFGWLSPDGTRRFRVMYLSVAKKNGKALALDTPIPTPNGWSTMGELGVDDLVFDDLGRPTRVIGVSDVMVGHECYEVTFSDGEKIVADAGHLWVTRTVDSRGKEDVRTTDEIRRSLKKNRSVGFAYNHAIRLAGPLQLPERELPIHPYVLGVWLGDGYSDSGRFVFASGDAEILGHIADCGETVVVTDQQVNAYDRTRFADCFTARLGSWKDSGSRSCCMCGCQFTPSSNNQKYCSKRCRWKRDRIGCDVPSSRNECFRERLANLDVLGNKHIPEAYLWASYEQRLALLQGLMDTDGCVCRTGTTSKWATSCEFSNTNKQLAEQVLQLATSLGFKATLKQGRSVRSGKHYGGVSKDCGAKYRVTWTSYADTPVFRLSRKRDALPPRPSKRTSSQSRRIIDVCRVDSVPVKCIKVDSESSLYLAGRSMIPTHNTASVAALALYMLVADGESNAQVYLAANDRAQAGICFNNAANYVKASKSLKKYLSIIPSTKRITFEKQYSFLQALSRETCTSDGLDAHLVVYDELHQAPNAEMFNTLRYAGSARSQPLFIVITTAGSELDTICGKEYQYAKKVTSGEVVDTSFLSAVFEPPADADPSDPEVWRLANPSLDLMLREDDILVDYKAACEDGTLGNFKRRRLNIWAKDASYWMPREKWEACGTLEFPELAELMDYPSWLGLDLADTGDINALVAVWRASDSQVYVRPWFWCPEESVAARSRETSIPYAQWVSEGWLLATEGATTDYEQIFDTIVELSSQLQLVGLCYDPWQAASMMNRLQILGIQTIKIPQMISHLSEPTKALGRMIRNQEIVHDGNPVLSWMVSNVITASDRNNNIRPDRKRSKEKIDGVAALVTALARVIVSEDVALYGGTGIAIC